jgi:DNA polymerase III delta subunit
MQYTIRGIPPEVDRALRQRARAEGKSLNEAAIDALAEATGGRHSNKKRRNLRNLVGTWKPDRELKAALADQDKVDPDLWR